MDKEFLVLIGRLYLDIYNLQNANDILKQKIMALESKNQSLEENIKTNQPKTR